MTDHRGYFLGFGPVAIGKRIGRESGHEDAPRGVFIEAPAGR